MLDRQTDRWTDRWINILIDRFVSNNQIDGQMDRQMDMKKEVRPLKNITYLQCIFLFSRDKIVIFSGKRHKNKSKVIQQDAIY